jgi:hypothetical protein
VRSIHRHFSRIRLMLGFPGANQHQYGRQLGVEETAILLDRIETTSQDHGYASVGGRNCPTKWMQKTGSGELVCRLPRWASANSRQNSLRRAARCRRFRSGRTAGAVECAKVFRLAEGFSA